MPRRFSSDTVRVFISVPVIDLTVLIVVRMVMSGNRVIQPKRPLSAQGLNRSAVGVSDPPEVK
jgi:hypothetical protein